jgi:iron(III) transport system substrate-binding protein
MTKRLNEKFPDYDIIIDYKSTGNHAAKLLAEGEYTFCDITHDLEYIYLDQLDQAGLLADLSSFNRDIYLDDVNKSDNYIVELRNGGAIIVNLDILEKKGLSKPTCYQDLLKPEYKNLISMPNPKSSGTGYMFLKSLVNAWGEEEALSYFDSLTENVLAYTSSGSGPVNALTQGEVAIGLGMTAQAVTKINEGVNLEILYFEEGSPFTLYGQSIVKGKDSRKEVVEVFEYLVNEYNYINNELFFPEKIYKDKDYVVKNYPSNILYAEMSNDTITSKEILLEKWKY